MFRQYLWRIFVCPPHITPLPVEGKASEPVRLQIRLDPGQAFKGVHEGAEPGHVEVLEEEVRPEQVAGVVEVFPGKEVHVGQPGKRNCNLYCVLT